MTEPAASIEPIARGKSDRDKARRAAPAFCEDCRTARLADIDDTGEARCPTCGRRLNIRYQVFISFSSQQMAIATKVCERFVNEGMCCWFAPDAIRVGDQFDELIVAALGQVSVVVLVLSQAAERSPWVQKEIRRAVSRGVKVLPLRVEEFTVSQTFQWLLDNSQWMNAPIDRLDEGLDELVAKARAVVLAAAAQVPLEPTPAAAPVAQRATVRAGVDPRNSPYAGPRPFLTSMADKFFGRDGEAVEILDRLAHFRALLIYAPSGAGKSSLLKTLIRQALQHQNVEVMDTVRFGLSLPHGVSEAQITNIFSFYAVDCLNETIVADAESTVAEFMASRRPLPGSRGRVIIFDQFEEFFTKHADRFMDRAAFFSDIIAALRAEPSLRVIFSMRQEYLADMKPLAEAFEGPLRMSEFALRRMDRAGALKAITAPAAPFADFAPGVAEEIVSQLYVIRIPGPDGKLIEKTGEFIEMVHLQIVCERLWKSLPKGTTRIELSHLVAAAGENASFHEFVASALNCFFADTIDAIAASDDTKAGGAYPKELIKLGCMKFVTTAGARTMAPLHHGRVGRLPIWIVKQLEDAHLLRSEMRGSETWYELSHDRLAEQIAKQMDRTVTELLFATDLLDRVMQNVLRANHQSLAGYFEAHADVLHECRPFCGQQGLFADEQEFLFRTSLPGNVQLHEWSQRLRFEHPDRWNAVLHEALASPQPAVRTHIVMLIGKDRCTEFGDQLVAVSLRDADAGVRTAATEAIGQLDNAMLYAQLADAAAAPTMGDAALTALAELRIRADQEAALPTFEGHWMQLGARLRRRVRLRSRRMRWQSGASAIPLIVLPATLFAMASAGIFKWFPGMKGWAMCQDVPSPFAGMFQGAAAGFCWGGGITMALTIYYLIWFTPRRGCSAVRPLGALLTGAVAGILTSAAVNVMVLGVYAEKSIYIMGWINDPTEPRFGWQFLSDLFVSTGCGWVYIITGIALGLGFALYLNWLLSTAEVRDMLQARTQISSLRQLAGVIRDLMRALLRGAWTLPVLLLIAGAIAVHVVHLGPGAFNDSKLPPHPSVSLCIFFDCMTQCIGAYFAIVGMVLGMVIMNRGLRVKPSER